MKQHIFSYDKFFESAKKKNNTDLILTLCVGMLLINPEFLDNILDKGLKGRYTHDTNMFLNDLKTLLTKKNRFVLGQYQNKEIIEDTDLGKINTFFNDYTSEFNIEEDWKILKKAREIHRTISNELLFGERLTPDMIKTVYWLKPNKETFDIAIKTNIDTYLISLKPKNHTKTKSFNTIADILLGTTQKTVFEGKYIELWDNLTRAWVRTIYENVKPHYKLAIDQFFDFSRVESLTFDALYEIEIEDKNYKRLGKYFSVLDKNYRELHKLLSDIFKKKEAFNNFNEFIDTWNKIKKEILYSRIIEDILLSVIEDLMDEEKSQEDDSMIVANDTLKMRLMKLIVELLSVEEHDIFYFKRDEMIYIPSRKWFRNNFNKLRITFDFHTPLNDDGSNFKIRLSKDNKHILTLNMNTNFSGGEMSGRLSTKYEFDFSNDINFLFKQ